MRVTMIVDDATVDWMVQEAETLNRPVAEVMAEHLHRTAQIPLSERKLTLGASALITMYYFFTLGDASLMETSLSNSCNFDNQGVFDIHACMHYLQSSVDTSSFELFLEDAQGQLADLWEQVPDTEKIYSTLEKIWVALQNDQCHIHDEL